MTRNFFEVVLLALRVACLCYYYGVRELRLQKVSAGVPALLPELSPSKSQTR